MGHQQLFSRMVSLGLLFSLVISGNALAQEKAGSKKSTLSELVIFGETVVWDSSERPRNREHLKQNLTEGRIGFFDPTHSMIAQATMKKLARIEAKQDCMLAAMAEGGGNMGQKAAACVKAKESAMIEDPTKDIKVSSAPVSSTKTKSLGMESVGGSNNSGGSTQAN